MPKPSAVAYYWSADYKSTQKRAILIEPDRQYFTNHSFLSILRTQCYSPSDNQSDEERMMRITVRIDDSYEQKIKVIQQRTQLNTTDVIKQAIDLMYEQAELNTKEKNRKLLAKLSGIGHGPEDGSINYKRYIAEYIDEKFNHR